MNTAELRAFEMAIEKTLSEDDFYNAGEAEIDRFLNIVRGHIAGKIRIIQGGDNLITAIFPTALAMPEKIHPTTKRLRQEKEDA